MANPVVKIRPVRRGDGRYEHVVWCSTDLCDFVYIASVKVDAQQQQRQHRMRHRTARNSTRRS